MIHQSFVRIALAILTASFCQAQEEQQLSLQFLAFPPKADAGQIELLVGEKKTIQVDTPGNELSAEYKVARPEALVVGITTKNEKNEPVFQVLGKAAPLATKKQIVLLIRKGENNSDGFEMIPINSELNDFSGGSYLLVNVSQLNIGGTVGDKNFALKPGQRNLLKPNATHEGGACQVTIAYQRDENDQKGKKIYDTRWVVNPAFRTLVFFYQDPETKKLGIAPIVHFL